MLESDAYISLSARGHLLLSNLLSQFSGSNNGDLSATYSEMKKRGFGSKTTLSRALKELLDKGLILLTRFGSYGSIRQCNLYAIGWLSIPEMPKLDIPTPTDAPNGWKTWEPKSPSRRVDSLDTSTPLVGKTGPTGGTKQVHTGETIPSKQVHMDGTEQVHTGVHLLRSYPEGHPLLADKPVRSGGLSPEGHRNGDLEAGAVH